MKKRRKKRTPVGLILFVIVLVLAALFLAYLILARQGILPDYLGGILSEESQTQTLQEDNSSRAEEAPAEATRPAVTEESLQEESTESSEEPESSASDEASQPAESASEQDSEETESSDESSSEESSSEESSAESSQAEESSAEEVDLPYYYYADEVPGILSELTMGNASALAKYVGSDGLRLSPTGILADSDVILSREEVENFMSMSVTNYGTNASSGQALILSPAEYFTKYISPVDLDFAAAKTLDNDPEDLKLAESISGARTISFYYAPSSMEWRKIILVFSQEGTPTGGDALRAIIYKDMTTY
jgi:hypothetical protein